ncbi:MAG: tRNA pseudouridine(38-40) synthase TruA [Betaproteobacteria bacterium]|nr:tRNA pseudouridine(38-40) synthase TruA [Betaproteobacteria bacterium]
MTAGRIAVGLEYDGGKFRGWQSQPCGGGIQDAVQRAFSPANGAPVSVHSAGRTDAGVHAAMQIAHFDTAVNRPPEIWIRAANAVLPSAVRVLWAQTAAAEFHARYSAIRRHYTYVILSRPHPSALWRDFAAFCPPPLSLAAMRAAIEKVRGRHDFSAFRAASCRAKTPVRTIYSATAKARGDFLLLEFCADGFLHRMVRNLVGAVLAVGKGEKPPEWMEEVLLKKERSACPPPAAAAGLYFCGADYPPQFNFIPPPRRPPFFAIPEESEN